MIKEALGYFGRSFWGITTRDSDLEWSMERGKLYHRWGGESGELDDFQESYNHLFAAESGSLDAAKNLECCELLLDNLQNILKLRLKVASETFEFLCDHRMRIELRDLDFKKELHDRIEEFMAFEEGMLEQGEELKKLMLGIELPDKLKGKRKDLLESFDRGMKSVTDGLEAFYHRVKDYVLKG